MSSVLKYGGLLFIYLFIFQHNMRISLLLWASLSGLIYLECSTSYLPGGSNGLIPGGLFHHFFVGERGKEKRMAGRISETSFAYVNIAVIEISDSNAKIDDSQTLWISQPSI